MGHPADSLKHWRRRGSIQMTYTIPCSGEMIDTATQELILPGVWVEGGGGGRWGRGEGRGRQYFLSWLRVEEGGGGREGEEGGKGRGRQCFLSWLRWRTGRAVQEEGGGEEIPSLVV